MSAALTRRRALAGSALAALGLGAPVALAAATEAKGASPQPLLSPEARGLQAELARLSHEYRTACREADDTLDDTAEVPPPEELFARPGDGALFARVPDDSWFDPARRWWADRDLVEKLRDDTFRSLAGDRGGRAEARRDEVVGAWDRWQADRRAAEDASGHTAANERFLTAFWAYHAFRERLAETRTADPEVMVAKGLCALDLCRDRGGVDVLIAKEIERDSGAYEEALALSLLRDFLGLIGVDRQVTA